MHRALSDRGFEHRRKGVFHRYVSDSVLDWVGLIESVFDGELLIFPKIGVRHIDLERRVDILTDVRMSVYPTISDFLGYWMPNKTANYRWVFRGDAEECFEVGHDLARSISEFGGEFFERYHSLDAVAEQLRREVPWEYSRLRIPVALELLGRTADAKSFVQNELRGLEGHEDPASAEFREFSARWLVALRSAE
jgi:hypothetical protein